MLQILLRHGIDDVEEALVIPFFRKRRSKIQHDEISNKQDTLFGQEDEHSIISFSSLHKNQLDTHSSDFQNNLTINSNIRLETPHIFEIEAFPKEMFGKVARSVELKRNLFLPIAPGV